MKNIVELFLVIDLMLSVGTGSRPGSSVNTPKQPFELSVDQRQITRVRNVSTVYSPGTIRGITIPLKLTNNTGDTLKYVNMSCASDMIFSVNTPEIDLFRHICDKNIPKVYAVPPHSSEVISEVLVVGKKARPGDRFRVGIRLIDASKYDVGAISFVDIANPKSKIIWSNEVHLN